MALISGTISATRSDGSPALITMVLHSEREVTPTALPRAATCALGSDCAQSSSNPLSNFPRDLTFFGIEIHAFRDTKNLMSIIPRRPRSAALEAHLNGTVHRWLAANGAMPFDEVTTSWGIVDVVGIRANVDRVIERLAAGQHETIGDFRSVLVLLEIPRVSARKACSLEELKERFGQLIGVGEVERIVAKLIRKRMVKKLESGRLIRELENAAYHDELICVELKLSRIDDVVAQARRHRVAATSSFVGLPAEVAERVAFSSRRAEFEAAGVGLLSINQDNCFVLIPSGNTDAEREFAHEIAVAEKGWRAISEAIKH